MSDAAGPKQFHQASDPRSMNELASERATAAVGNGQSPMAQFSPRPHLPMLAPNLYQPHFPQAAMTTAAAMQQPAMLPMGAYPQQTMMTGQPPPGAHMGVFRPPPPSQPFVPQPAMINHGGQLPPQYAAALLQQMQQEAANRRPPASPLTAPIARVPHPGTAGVAQPPSDDPFRSEHGRGNGVITFYVSTGWSASTNVIWASGLVASSSGAAALDERRDARRRTERLLAQQQFTDKGAARGGQRRRSSRLGHEVLYNRIHRNQSCLYRVEQGTVRAYSCGSANSCVLLVCPTIISCSSRTEYFWSKC